MIPSRTKIRARFATPREAQDAAEMLSERGVPADAVELIGDRSLEVRHPTLAEPAVAWLRELGPEAVGTAVDPVDQSAMESFPASDPPSWTPGKT